MQQLLSERIRHLVTFSCALLVFSYVMAFKISLIYVQGCEKRNSTHTCQHVTKIRFENSDFVILDRYIYQAAIETSIDSIVKKLSRPRQVVSVEQLSGTYPVLMNNHSSLVSWKDLLGFNTKLELLFFEVLNTSQIYPITSKMCFVKILTNSI